MDEAQSSKMVRIGRYALGAAVLAAILAVALRYRQPAGEVAKADPAADSAAAGAPHAIEPMIAGLEAKLKANPGDAEGWRMLGQSYFSLSRFGDATRAFARAAALAPTNADAWSALGEAIVYAHKDGVDADAAHAFERAVGIDPKDARARYFLAVRKDLGGDHKGAIDDWIALLKDTPAGAPWESSVRTLVEQVAVREKIDIGGRMPAATAAPVQSVATDAIPGPSQTQMADAARMSPSEQNAMAKTMVDRLAARLAQNPKDAEGWARLMRARLVLGDRAGAGQAYASAKSAFAGDAATLAQLKQAAGALGLAE
jgi:cytochrome c-type biogenesis protein CcmH